MSACQDRQSVCYKMATTTTTKKDEASKQQPSPPPPVVALPKSPSYEEDGGGYDDDDDDAGDVKKQHHEIHHHTLVLGHGKKKTNHVVIDYDTDNEYDETTGKKVKRKKKNQHRHPDVKVVGDDNGEDEEDEEHDVLIVYWNIQRTSDRPCTCCCQLCGIWLLLFVLLAVLGTIVSPITFSLGVPFYNRAEINSQRWDAYTATASVADYVSNLKVRAEGGEVDINGNDLGSGECVNDFDNTKMTRNGTLLEGSSVFPTSTCQRSSSNFLRLVYVSKDRKSNILTSENLQQIYEIESYILNKLGLSQYCYLLDASFGPLPTRDRIEIATIVSESIINNEPNAYISCERINSVLNFIDPLYFDYVGESGLGYYILPNDVIVQEYDYDSIDNVVKYWSNYTQRTYDLSDYTLAIPLVGNSLTVRNLFWRVTSSDFSVGSTSSVGVTSTYSLGTPIHGYVSSSNDFDSQISDTGSWLHDTFDEYLKGQAERSNLKFDIYWNDQEGGMHDAEIGSLAIASMIFFPISLVIVLLYLMYMQDSIFLGFAGIGQILLSFIPTILVYGYVIGEDYIGILNLIAIYIILGIGVDNLFVFCDQFHHQRHYQDKQLDKRLQKTFNVAGKAMFTTSCTTFISFISNARSAFPAVSTFGLFAALLVLMNYLAVIIYFPAVYTVYYTRIRKIWFDHPSLLCCCKFDTNVPGIEEHEEQNDKGEGNDDEEDDDDEEEAADGVDKSKKKKKHKKKNAKTVVEGESALVAFFRDTWAPMIVKLRYPIVVFYTIVFVLAAYGTTQLEPDKDAPSTLPIDNNYKVYRDVVLKYFQRAGNPSAIQVRWVSGIDPDYPIDREGTDSTNLTDYGIPQFLDCNEYDPTTPAAQVWSLNTCHDLFFGNVTAYHETTDANDGGATTDDDVFGPDGSNGPKSRLVVTENVPMSEYNYYSVVKCVAQGMRDWLLTDKGCDVLTSRGLPCVDVTSQRPDCIMWDATGENSCEPYPVPSEHLPPLLAEFLNDDFTDPVSGQTNYDKYSDLIFVGDNVDFDKHEIVRDDFSCRSGDLIGNPNTYLFAISSTAKLEQDIGQKYEDGLALYDKWNAWSISMRANAPREMIGTMITSNGAWAFYFLNETLVGETFMGIAIALVLSMVVLTLIGGNIIMAFFAVSTIVLIVLDVFAFTVVAGWSLGVVEAVNYVVVIGMSIDYAVHMSEAYTSARADTRAERVILMMEEMGVSVLSGALSTLFAVFLMFFAPNRFFFKFATFMFVTIALSCIYAMTFFPALLACIGPMGNAGEIYYRITKLRRRVFHEFTKEYILSKEFMERENKLREEAAQQN